LSRNLKELICLRVVISRQKKTFISLFWLLIKDREKLGIAVVSAQLSSYDVKFSYKVFSIIIISTALWKKVWQ